jgi:hypothetical protein
MFVFLFCVFVFYFVFSVLLYCYVYCFSFVYSCLFPIVVHIYREVRQCLLLFGSESFVFQIAIQKFKDQDI